MTYERDADADNPTNAQRAEWGRLLMAAYVPMVGESIEDAQDAQDALTDVLADLFHWAKSRGLDLELAAGTAANHFAFETGQACPVCGLAVADGQEYTCQGHEDAAIDIHAKGEYQRQENGAERAARLLRERLERR